MPDSPAPRSETHQGDHLVPVRRALISVSDKTGLADFATALVNEFNVQLISTGGTARFLREAGLPVTDVSEITGFPEMMDGRVKTLHPKVHGGLLALRDDSEHVAAMKAHGIEPIDLVVINLYPFKDTIDKPGVTFEEAIENIDIGGPSMVRSAAKNHRFVLVLTSPDRYEKALGDLRKHQGASCAQHRLKQAQRAFAHTAEYDGLIAEYLLQVVAGDRDEAALKTPQTGSGTARHGTPPISGVVATAAEESRRSISEVHDVLVRQAVAVSATEAAYFAVSASDQSLTALAHIRPDSSSQAVRAAAIQAFRELVAPCISQHRDGAIEVEKLDQTRLSQYCLVSLDWLASDRGRELVGVSAVIVRCADSEQANECLLRMRKFDAEAKFSDGTNELPSIVRLPLSKKQTLRYGENPHQPAALYTAGKPSEASVAFATQHHGKELSYINLLDADAALSAVKEFHAPAACIVKHATPCGYATATDLPTAFKNAFAGDPLAAFGGIVALNRTVDLATAQAITSIDKLLEVIVAPNYAAEALELLKNRWKNCRLLAVGPVSNQFDTDELMLHKIVGGYLVQRRDLAGNDLSQWKVVSKRRPTDVERTDLQMAWMAAKHVKSNAIAIARGGMMLGSGAGQQDRVNACRIAIAKAGDRARGAAAGSDAFFPFPDGPELLLDAGVTAIIHPGGSVKDQETIDLVDRRGATMVLTGQRHFRH